jgi:YggT family protein
MIAQTIRLLFSCYTIFLIIRVIGSWLPQLRYHNFMRFIAYYTDPYLDIFRKIIPPIGGMIDISPLIGFLFLQLMEKVLLNFFR